MRPLPSQCQGHTAEGFAPWLFHLVLEENGICGTPHFQEESPGVRTLLLAEAGWEGSVKR